VPIRISAAILKDNGRMVIGGVEAFRGLSEVERLEKELQSRYTFEEIVGRTPAMMRLFEVLPQIAENSSTVLIEGATRLMDHDFPGIVRELENIIEQAFVVCRGSIIEPHHLPSEFAR
jgi:transcriptional regulator with PAS, ATPase and Fis domain